MRQLSTDNIRVFHKFVIPLHEIIINYRIMPNLNRIKVVLVEKGKTGKWLADELGKTPCTVSKWCSNSIQPDLNTIDKIATILNVDRRTLIEPSKL
jgi:ribosome-binding protein aMBF1 (putative translation factor)